MHKVIIIGGGPVGLSAAICLAQQRVESILIEKHLTTCAIAADPVTGSAHCMIAPYWCARLNKQKIHACQGGKRQG